MYKTIICFFILVVVYSNLFAQNATGQLVYNIKEQHKLWVKIKQPIRFKIYNQQSYFFAFPYMLSSGGFAMQFIKPKATQSTFFLTNFNVVASDRVSIKSGWFCQQEWKFEKTTSIPLKIRLGSVDAVDYLEGKKAHH